MEAAACHGFSAEPTTGSQAITWPTLRAGEACAAGSVPKPLFVCLFVCLWRMGGLPSIEGVVVEVMKLLLGVQPCARRRSSIARQSCPSHAVMHVVRCNRYSAFNPSRAVPSAQADSSASPRAWHAAAVCSQKESLSGQCSVRLCCSATSSLSVAIARASLWHCATTVWRCTAYGRQTQGRLRADSG